jgi:hypothetical protein
VTHKDLHKESTMSLNQVREDRPIVIPDEPAADLVDENTAADNEQPEPIGDPRALLVARLLAAGALLVSAVIHGRLAIVTDSAGGALLSQSHLFAAQAALSVVIAGALLTKDSRAWLVAVVLSVAGLGAILSSVYFPLPSVGPLPAIDEPSWLLTKATVAFAELSVIVLWVIRSIAPPK